MAGFLADLLQASSFLALSFLDVIWGLLAVVVFFTGLLLIVIILIQDSKDSGLTSAFGGGGGGSALLGARMQKGLARMTAMIAIVFALSVTVMGIISNSTLERSVSEEVPVGEGRVVPEVGGPVEAGAAPDGAPPIDGGGAAGENPGGAPDNE